MPLWNSSTLLEIHHFHYDNGNGILLNSIVLMESHYSPCVMELSISDD